MEQKKKPEKPKYGAFSNIAFTMKNIFHIDKMLLVSMIALVFCMVAQPVIGVLMPKYIIQFFEEKRDVTALLLLVAVFGAVSLVLGQIRSFADGYFPRMKSMYRSMRLGAEMCLASMQVDYKHLSSEAGQLENRKAQHAISSPRDGVEDIVVRIVECSANLLGTVVYIFILYSVIPQPVRHPRARRLRRGQLFCGQPRQPIPRETQGRDQQGGTKGILRFQQRSGRHVCKRHPYVRHV